MWIKGNACTLLAGCKLQQSLCKTAHSLLKILKRELLYDLASLHPGTYLKKMKTLIGKYACTQCSWPHHLQ